MDRFSKDMNVLVSTRLTSINDDDFSVRLWNEDPGRLGSFGLGTLRFEYVDRKFFEGDHPTEMWEPKKMACICGGVHAISKKFMMHLGMFDPDFDVWGCEDIE